MLNDLEQIFKAEVDRIAVTNAAEVVKKGDDKHLNGEGRLSATQMLNRLCEIVGSVDAKIRTFAGSFLLLPLDFSFFFSLPQPLV